MINLYLLGDVSMIDYTVVKSKRKTIAIQVKEDGKVIVRAPRFCTQKRIREFVNEKTDWILRAQEKQAEATEKFKGLNEAEITMLKAQAKVILKDKVDYYSQLMGVEAQNVKITSARKRFGSCNSKGSICFSYRLMLYPEEAIDYVVVHELAHLLELNHSKLFYDIVSNVLLDYKKREKMLR